MLNYASETKKAIGLLLLIYLGFASFRGVMGLVVTLLPEMTAMDKALLYKITFAIILAAILWYFNYFRHCGFTARMNCRLLPIYWPFLAILLLILAGSEPQTDWVIWYKVTFFALAVAFAEETLFRGLVIHWFRHLSPRKLILLSGIAFGMMHLFGLASDIPASVILAQAYFASALGVIFAYGRIKDHSIWLAILVHWIFDLVAIGAKGGVSETFSNQQEATIGLLFTGTLAWLWSLYLVKKAGKIDAPKVVAS